MSAVDGVRVFAYVTAVCIVFLIVESAATCDMTLVPKCTETFSSERSPDKFIYTKEERKVLCQDLEAFLKCFDETGCRQLPVVVPVYEGLKNALNFTCSDDNHQHEQTATCWEWNGFQTAQNFCYKMYGNSSGDSNCEDRSSTISCVVRSIDKCCGEVSAVYAKKMATLMLEPAFKMSGCELDLDKDVRGIDECLSAPSGPNVGLIIVIIFVIIVIAVIIVVIIIIKKSRTSERLWTSM